MLKLSAILNENKQEPIILTKQEWDDYVAAIEKTKRSKEFMNLLWILGQHPELHNKEQFDLLIADKPVASIDDKTQKDIIRVCKKIGGEINLLPQNLTLTQREYIISKKIDPNDMTLDMETEKGRNEIAKRYMPLVTKMVNQYADNGLLSKEELLSAAYMGLVEAMNEYKNPEEMIKAGKSGNMSFTKYAAYRIKQAILNDLNANGRNVKLTDYMQKKREEEGLPIGSEVSIDHLAQSDDDDLAMNIDRFINMSDMPDVFKNHKDLNWDEFFKLAEKNFSQRDCNIIYRNFGLKGFKEESVKDIARDLNISAPAVVQAMKRFYKWAKTNKEARACLESYADEFICKLLCETSKTNSENIVESLLSNETYMFFESLNKWRKAENFQKSVNKATDKLNVDDALYIFNVIGGLKDIIEKEFNTHKFAVIEFLNTLYPDQSFAKAQNNELEDEMRELKAISDKFMIKW